MGYEVRDRRVVHDRPWLYSPRERSAAELVAELAGEFARQPLAVRDQIAFHEEFASSPMHSKCSCEDCRRWRSENLR